MQAKVTSEDKTMIKSLSTEATLENAGLSPEERELFCNARPKAYEPYPIKAVEDFANWCRANSLWILAFGTGCGAIELRPLMTGILPTVDAHDLAPANAFCLIPKAPLQPGKSYTATIQYEDSTLVPDAAFSLGVGTGISAYHFNVTSQAEFRRNPGNETDRDAEAIHTQAFYIVGPESSTL